MITKSSYLSDIQIGIYTDSLIDMNVKYNVSIDIVLFGLDTKVFKKSVAIVAKRHEALRCCISDSDGIPVLRIFNECPLPFEEEDVSFLDGESKDTRLRELRVKNALAEFNLHQAPLFRMKLVKIEEGKHLFLICAHHVIMDGMSVSIMLRQIIDIYNTMNSGGAVEDMVDCRLSDFLENEAKKKAEGNKSQREEYWRETLSGAELPEFPMDPKGIARDYHGDRQSVFGIPRKLYEKVAERSKGMDATVFMYLLSVFAVLMRKYDGQKDALFVSPFSSRPFWGYEDAVGCFVKNVPLRFAFEADTAITDLVEQARKQMIGAYKNIDCPLADLLRDLKLPGNAKTTSVFDISFGSDVYEREEKNAGIRYEILDREIVSSPGTISFTLDRKNGEYVIRVLADPRLFSDMAIELIGRHYLFLLASITSDPSIRIADCEMIDDDEKARILGEFNATEAEYPRGKTIVELFEETAARLPERTAIVAGVMSLSYRELNERSNAVGKRLEEKGIRPNDRVGLLVDRNEGLLVGLLGILKSGAGYVPMDTEYPEKRLKYMFDDAGMKAVVSMEKYRSKIRSMADVDIICVDDDSVREGIVENPAKTARADDMAYMIYTSGTTGNPKGVVVKNQGVVNLIWGLSESAGVKKCKTFLNSTTVSFDIFGVETLLALIQGLTIHTIDDDVRGDPDAIIEYILRNGIDAIQFTPSRMKTLELERLSGKVSVILVGGEALTEDVKQRILSVAGARAFNVYGPTETTIWSTVNCINDFDSTSIGRPIANTRIYILGSDMKICPIGVVGELCIGGDGVARGYLNRPELTAEKFVADPYRAGERIYRTGDLARWLPDGNIECLGRLDEQVKIRGFRIELGEIEAALNGIAGVKGSVVTARAVGGSGEKSLCAYLVCDGEPDVGELRGKLRETLPEYMVPSYFVRIEEIPLTANGKVDKRKLPEPSGEMLRGNEYVEPRTETEREVARIWGEVLGLERVGARDDFFEIGGNSIKAIQMIGRIRKELGSGIEVKDVFSRGTVEGLAEEIGKRGREKYERIGKAEEREWYPVTSSQRRMVVLRELEGAEGVTYNIPAFLWLEGAVDEDRVEGAFRSLEARHESLRTNFEMRDGEIVQRISAAGRVSVARGNVRAGEEEGKKREFVRPFDLGKEPLIRAELAKADEGRYLLCVDMHHSVSDGTSMGVLIREFGALYRGEDLGEPELQYKDYAVWQGGEEYARAVARAKEYWSGVYAEPAAVLELPTDYERAAVRDYRGATRSYRLDEARHGAVRELCRRRGLTPFMFYLTILNIVLSKYGRQEDIVVGTPVSGRRREELEGVVGMFVNTLALRSLVKGEMSVGTCLEGVKAHVSEAYEHDAYQFEDLLEALDVPRDVSRNPLFDVMFTWMDIEGLEVERIDLSGARLRAEDAESEIAKFDLTVTGSESDGGAVFSIEYASGLYRGETIDRLWGHYEHALDQALEDEGRKVCEIELATGTEKAQILGEFNETGTKYPREKTIVELFEETVALHGERQAVEGGEAVLSYRELNERANLVARRLRELGVGREDLVGVVMDRGPWMVASLLGILKSGGAYVPMDAEYPDERIRYMLSDSGARVVVSEERHRGRLIGCGAEAVECFEGAEAEAGLANPERVNEASDLAYVIYTSGTTGKPKGALISHRNVVRLIRDTNYVNVGSGNAVLQLSNYAFDGSVFDIYAALCNGARLCLIEKEAVLNVEALCREIKRRGVDTFFVTTALFNTLVDFGMESLTEVKSLLFGGERVSYEHAKRALELMGPGRLYHVYGPTETTVYATYHMIDRCDDGLGTVPIGRPIANSTAYIFDGGGKLCPIGVPGELCLGGDGVARGYLNRTELTDEKFVADPYRAGKKMYRSGDLAKWLHDGNIEFLGRLDEQVKIRGFRIELGEIEAALNGIAGVKGSVVTARAVGGSGEKSLCAYLVCDGEPDVGALRGKLRETLPEYMVPSYFVRIEEIPLTANGKVDKRKLPEPSGEMLRGNEYVEPRTETEREVARIWGEVLGLERVGARDDFFEIGGNSIKAIQMIGRIRKELGSGIEVKDVFSRGTVEGLAEEIGKRGREKYERIGKAEEREWYPVTSSQRRMVVLRELEGAEGVTYNIPAFLWLEGAVDEDRVEGAFRSLEARHESLRTNFEMRDGEIVQRISAAGRVSVARGNVRAGEEEGKKREFVRPFDLGKEPLIRAELAKADEGRYLLCVDMHHSVSDGTSMGVLIREFGALYRGEDLGEPELQYKDYAVWQGGEEYARAVARAKEYWSGVYAEPAAVLELPTDYERAAVRDYRGATRSYRLDEARHGAVRELCRRRGLTPFMFYLTILNIVLSKYGRQEDIVVGTPVSGRRREELEGVVGMFVNTLALRSLVKGEMSVGTCLEGVKAHVSEAYEHDAYQFEDLLEALDVPRDVSRNPLFDVMFTWMDIEGLEVERIDLGGVRLRAEKTESGIAKFDLTVTGSESDGGAVFSIEYASGLYRGETIDRLWGHYEHALDQALEDEGRKVCEIELATEAEKARILGEFNATEAEYPRGKTIVELFEETAARLPERTAIVAGVMSLSYRELNERSNAVGKRLEEKGIRPNDRVGLLVDRNEGLLVGLLGILKSGAGYVPMDTEYPEKRLKYMFDDAGMKAVVSMEKYRSKIRSMADVDIICVDDDSVREGIVENPAKTARADDMAYMIYTSGTTGNPKGVVVKNQGVVNLIWGLSESTGVKKCKTFLNSTTVSFDIFGVETLLALIQGLTIHTIDDDVRGDPDAIIEYILRNGIDAIQFTPSRMKTLELERLSGKVSVILVGGEALTEDVKQRILSVAGARAFNVYGPTETTIWSTVNCINDFDSTSIGRPIANTRIYILGSDMKICPIGVVGELCIGGDGVARGYLNRPELTAEKFVADPYRAGERIYRTGDLARWLPDGNIECLGRLDEQVKIRGFRIELGEIEAALNGIAGVKGSVVTARAVGGSGEKSLCAYLVCDGEPDVGELRGKLRETLPEYMVPSYFVRIEEIPLTANGKVDKRKLPEPSGEMLRGNEYVEPRTESEREVARIWGEVLGLERVGVRDNFFEIGGNSIKAIQVIGRMNEASFFVSINELFLYKAIEALQPVMEQNAKVMDAKAIGISEDGDGDPWLKIGDDGAEAVIDGVKDDIIAYPKSLITDKKIGRFPLSGMQRMHLKIGSSPSGFTMYVDDPNMDKELISRGIRMLARKHQLLHSVIIDLVSRACWEEREMAEEGIEFESRLAFIDIEGYSRNDQWRLIDAAVKKVHLDPYQKDAPRWRVLCMRLSGRQHLLLWGVDHVAFDGSSADVLKRQLTALLYSRPALDESAIKAERIVNFSEYVQLLSKGPQGVTEKGIMAMFSLDRWSKALKTVMDLLSASADKKRGTWQWKIPLASIPLDDRFSFVYCFAVDLVKELFSIEAAPMALLNYGRRYKDADFFGSVGEFLDVVPVLEGGGAKGLAEVLRVCHDHSINFTGLLADPRMLLRYPQVFAAMSSILKVKDFYSAILFNYLGGLNLDTDVITRSLADKLPGEDVLSFSTLFFQSSYDEKNLYLSLTSLYGIGGRMLEEATNALASKEGKYAGFEKFDIGNAND